jgi:hypothetical protein
MRLTPPNFNAALVEFQRAYELMGGYPRRYIQLSNIASCYLGLQQYDLAVEYYERYLREGGDRVEDRSEMEERIQDLMNRLGVVRVATNVPDAEVWIDDRRVTVMHGEVRTSSGRHTVEARAPGHVPARQEVEVVARQTVLVRFVLERVRAPRWLFWSSLAATGLAAGAGVACAVLAAVSRSEVDALLNGPDRFLVTGGDRQRIADYVTASYVSFGVAGGFAVATTILHFVTDSRRATTQDAPRALLVPHAGVDGVGLQLHGVF